MKKAPGVFKKARKASRVQGITAEEIREAGIKASLASSKITNRNPVQVIEQILNKEVKYSTIPMTSPLRTVGRIFEDSRLGRIDIAVAREFFQILIERSNVLDAQGTRDGAEHITFGVNILRAHKFWLRPISEWKPGVNSRVRQEASLIRHLFAKYSMPAFFDSAWRRGDDRSERCREWYIMLGLGENLRNQNGLPYPLTKKHVHLILNETPNDCGIEEAFTWGEVLNLGGDERVARGVLTTRAADPFMRSGKDQPEFWSSVWRFFIANPMLATERFGPVVDWLINQKYEGRVLDAQGHWNAPQPGLSMHGREPNATLVAVEAWHKSLTKIRKATAGVDKWTPSGIGPMVNGRGLWEITTGSKPDTTHWQVVELLTSKELREEGAALHHCVYSYTHTCKSGRVSIWSVRRFDKNGSAYVLTIEVNNQNRQIVQARGRYNKPAEGPAMNIAQRFATANALNISSAMWTRWM